MIKMTGKIYIVGIGPGSSEYLTKKAIDTVKTSDYWKYKSNRTV